MRFHLCAGVLVAGLALGCLLTTICRVPAGEIMVPSDHPSDRPVVQPEIPATALAVPTMLVNSRKIRLNYSITDVGPSGVSSVELWATRDGRTWQRYSNEPPPVGPLVVHVAEEGRYGFHLVVRSGVGVSSSAPNTGDAPQLWVEVDETRPTVRINDLSYGKGVDPHKLTICWTACDTHLTRRPITISIAAQREGPYKPLVRNLENTGKYVWDMPRDLPYQFFVRVEATDRAGNVGADVSIEPVRIDLTRPKGTIIGVDGEAKVINPRMVAPTPVATPPVEGLKYFITTPE